MPESELEPIVYVDKWKIREGKLGVKDAAREFVDFVAESEPQLIAYNVYIAEKATTRRSFRSTPTLRPSSST